MNLIGKPIRFFVERYSGERLVHCDDYETLDSYKEARQRESQYWVILVRAVVDGREWREEQKIDKTIVSDSCVDVEKYAIQKAFGRVVAEIFK